MGRSNNDDNNKSTKTKSRILLKEEELKRKKHFCLLISSILLMIAISVVFVTYMFIGIYKANNIEGDGDAGELFDGGDATTTIPSNNASIITDFSCWTRRLL